MLLANEIFMDAFYTDVRRRPRRLARGARPARRTRCGPTPRAATRSRSRPTASAAPRQDGAEHDDATRPSAELVARSNRLGADPKNTNYAGGNTSAKGTETDPVTGEPVELLWVKGSGGDLGTLTEAGLAVLRLDRMRALVDVYPGVEREDEMVAAFDYCLHGKGGAAPSIDTAMHGLVDAAHVDHLHPDSGIAIATAADGEALTKEIFGDKVVWVPWRRPGFQLGLDIAAIKAAEPAGGRLHPRRPRHHRVGRHQRGGRARTRCGSSTPPRRTSPSTARPSRSARRSTGTPRCPRPSAGRRPPRSRRPSVASPRRTGRWSATSPTRRGRARLPRRRRAPAAGRARHVVPRPLPAHQGQAAGPRPAGRPRRSRSRSRGSQELARGLPRGLPGLLRPERDAGLARRSAAPTR